MRNMMRALALGIFFAATAVAARAQVAVPGGTSPYINVGTVSSAGSPLIVPMNGANSICFTTTGTWSGTMVVKGDVGAGTYPWTIPLNASNATGFVANITSNGSWCTLAANIATEEFIFTTYTSGTMTINYSVAEQSGGWNYAPNVSSIISGGASSGVIATTNSDGVSRSVVALDVNATCQAYNGATLDGCRKDTYTAGPMWMTNGGSSITDCAAASNCSVKASAGRLARLTVTTVGTTGGFTCYNNTAASGVVIGGISAANGATLYYSASFDLPASTGIYCVSAANGPEVTVSYY